MDRFRKSTLTVLAFAFALMATADASAAMRAFLRARILPDLYTHLSYGSKSLDEGRFMVAMAHSDAVLLPTVNVHLEFDDVPAELRGDCARAVTDAFEAWRDGTDGETVFSIVDDPAMADVQITFVRHLMIDGRQVGGYTQWQRSVKIYASGSCTTTTTAAMQLIAYKPDGRPMNLNQMRQAAAHELGHILGMQDSSHMGDVMGALDLGRPVTVPRPEEIEAMREVRAEAQQLRARAQASLP